MAIKLGWSPLLDEWFGFGGGLANSPFEADRYWIGMDFMVIKKKKKIFFVFVKIKDTYTRTN